MYYVALFLLAHRVCNRCVAKIWTPWAPPVKKVDGGGGGPDPLNPPVDAP